MPGARCSRVTGFSCVGTPRVNELGVLATQVHDLNAVGRWTDRPSRKSSDGQPSRPPSCRRRIKSRSWGLEQPSHVGFDKATPQPGWRHLWLCHRGRGCRRAGKRRRGRARFARLRCVPGAAASFGLRFCCSGELFGTAGLRRVSHRRRRAVHKTWQCLRTRAGRNGHRFLAHRHAGERPAPQWQQRKHYEEEPGKSAHGALKSGAAQYKQLPNSACKRNASHCERAVRPRLRRRRHAYNAAALATPSLRWRRSARKT